MSKNERNVKNFQKRTEMSKNERNVKNLEKRTKIDSRFGTLHTQTHIIRISLHHSIRADQVQFSINSSKVARHFT